MNNKKLYYAQYYTYEARKDMRWLHRTIELLHQHPERGRYEFEEVGELFTNETIEVGRKLIQLMEIEKPQSKEISELYKLLKFYKGVRNSDWDNICKFVEKWHWVANIWDNFAGSIKLNLWNQAECKLYSIAKPLIAEGKFIRQSSSIGSYGHVVFHIEPMTEKYNVEYNIEIIWQVNDDKNIPFYYIPAIFEGINDAMIEYFHQTSIALTSLKIIIYDGNHHEIDSREIDYRIAAIIAWRKALENAELVKL
jgi:Elongation factor G, domain IV